MGAMAVAGCATAPPSINLAPKQRQTAVGDISNPEAEKPPFIGMTKALALARYGEPKRHTMTDEGENWVYILNFGEVMGWAMIPFNFSVTPVGTGVIIFDKNGRVKKFNWDTPTET